MRGLGSGLWLWFTRLTRGQPASDTYQPTAGTGAYEGCLLDSRHLAEHADAFNDITTGSSRGCDMKTLGFPATKGWDAVTGLGTPNYGKLAAVVAALP